MTKRKPHPGEFVCWRKPGPVVLHIERVGPWDLERIGWRVVLAGGLPAVIRYEPDEGVDWVVAHHD